MMMRRRSPPFTVIAAIKTIWAGWFPDPATWAPWRSFLRVLFGLPLGEADLALFRQCTGRADAPAAGFNEAWLICGRRSGKSFILALIAVFLAVFKDWSGYLSPGEVGVVKIVATDRRQARVIFRYALALVEKVPTLNALIDRQTDDEIVLCNSITIEVQTASFRSIRGFTIVALLADEIAFWPNDEASANPDSEILIAARAAMATLHGSAMLLAASSPYARRGEMFRAYRTFYGKPDAPVLVWKAPTRVMNSTVPQAFIDEQMERDSDAAQAEYLAEFRSDLADYISREIVDAAVVRDRFELPPVPGIAYVGAIDVSGGSADSQVAAVAFHDPATGRAMLAALREHRPPFGAEAAAAEDAELFRSYGVSRIVGDRYGGHYPVEAFQRYGIAYEAADRIKSDYYHDLLPLLTSSKAELLDHPRLISQIASLERRVSRSGKDSIDHPPGGRDDVANAAAIALIMAGVTVSPSLWRRADLLTSGGAPLPWPVRSVRFVFATLAADLGGIAVFFWAATQTVDGVGATLLIDFDLRQPMTPDLFATVRNRLGALASEAHAAIGGVITTAALAAQAKVAIEPAVLAHLDRGDVHAARAAELIARGDGDGLLRDRDAAALAAAQAIGAGRVKVCAPAHDKSLRSAMPLFAFRLGVAPDAATDAAMIGLLAGATDLRALPRAEATRHVGYTANAGLAAAR